MVNCATVIVYRQHKLSILNWGVADILVYIKKQEVVFTSELLLGAQKSFHKRLSKSLRCYHRSYLM